MEFEGATEGITEPQFNFIAETLEKKGFKNKKVLIEVVGAAGDNYMATVRRLVIHDEEGNPFKMIAKIAPNIEQLRISANTKHIFSNENIMYTEVLPKFKKMQVAGGVSETDILRFAECYGSTLEEPNEVILLEDLNVSHFDMLDRFTSLTDDCVRSVLRNFAILHSLSFVLKHKEPETFSKFGLKLYDVWSNMDVILEAAVYFKSIEERTIKLLSDNEARVQALQRASIGNIIELMSKQAKTDAGSKHNIIQQGDAWTNNIMFKFHGDTLLESVFIDYQMSKVTNPVCDIMYMIFNCVDHQTRRKHFHEWIDHYHTELDKALSNFDLKANYVYSKDQLDVDLKRYAKIMFVLSVILASVLTLNSEDAAILKQSMEAETDSTKLLEKIMTNDNQASFKSRVEGLVDSFIEFGLL